MSKVQKFYSIFFCFILLTFVVPMGTAFAQTCTDVDGDGYGLNGDASCPAPGVDCDDNDPNVYPDAPRICDAKDSDCDGFEDFFTDKDEDGDGSTLCAHWLTGLKDCNDSNPEMYPGNVEGPFGDPTCTDGFDNDCDYKTDGSDNGCSVNCVDSDGDGYGNPGNVTCPNGNALDCNDSNDLINPGVTDTNCNGVDDNCSGTADDGYVPTPTNCGTGECASTGTLTCSGGVESDSCVAGLPAKEGALGHPTCSDTLDNDCDGATDGTDVGCQSSCLDDDGDGYGHYGDASCPNAGVDCNDDNGAINPGATDDVCDGVDANCSGTPDDEYTPPVTNCGIGECATTGLLICNAGVPEDDCTPLAPGSEGPFGDPTCSDTLDNDCDGIVDAPDNDCNPLDQDNDGDGFCEIGPCQNPSNLGGDCDDTDAVTYPGATRICDARDNDCDGFQDFFTDVDNDGDGAPMCGGDCDDNNPNRFPGNIEGPWGDTTCGDFIDNDCDYRVDGTDAGCGIDCLDTDDDGYGNPGNPSCTNGGALDCDNFNALINPGATDTNCNAVDDNCSGTADDGYVVTPTNCGTGECASTGNLTCSNGVENNSCTPGTPVVEGPLGDATCGDTLDNDCDTFTDASDPGCQSSCLDDDGDGYGLFGDASCPNAGVDCDDNNSAINLGAADDVCDGVDANCSGTADDQYVPPVTNCGIGECATTGLLICNAGVPEDNCSPLAPGTEGPFGDPTCGDTLDNDCDGDIDAVDNSCNPLDIDNDGDSFCEGPTCSDGSTPGDCDDTDLNVYPAAARVCDGKDNDCDGFQDFFTDKDEDGDGATLCVHYQTGLQDCNDNDPNRFPGNIEAFGDPSCEDGIDNDCNYKIDGKDIKCLDQCNDGDGDGYGNPAHPSCANPELDCDNMNSLVNPGATDDTCDGVDNNCSGTADDEYVPSGTNCGTGECATTGTLTCSSGVETDSCTPLAPSKEGALGNPTCSDTLDNDCDGTTDASDIGCQSSCLDDDGDGYGYYGDASCANAGVDCDDDNAAINPGATDDVCDGVDANCSGTADDQYVPTPTNCGIGECATTGQLVCVAGAPEDNCTPLPAGVEDYLTAGVCTDTLDNDCDGDIDLGDIGCNPPDIDNDLDGFCEGPTCSDGSTPGDCNDTDDTVRPGGNTTVCDGKDTNCDGFQDFFSDVDNDGDGVPLCAGDCNDSDPDRYPGNQEGPFGDPTCNDGIDNDCNNKTDNADSQCAEPTCTTKTNPTNGPHMFDLLDGGNNVLKTPCQWCHFDDSGTVDERTKCERCHADAAWGGPDDGTLKAIYSGNPPYGFGTAQIVKKHSSTVVGTTHGAWDMECITCHNPHLQEQDGRYGTSYGKLIKEKICFDNAVTAVYTEEIIEFTAATGPGSFADGLPHNENICEMCHTQTSYHRNDGSMPVHNDSTMCTDCHLHSQGFKPTCNSCHGNPPIVNTATGGPDGLVDTPGVTGSLTAGAHDKHVVTKSYSCDHCHVNSAGSGPTHNDGAPQVVTIGFSLFGGTYEGGDYDGQSSVNYDSSEANTTLSSGGSKTCSNIYCHGTLPDGSDWAGGQNTSPVWDGTVDCSSCHDSGGSLSGLNFKHSIHTDENRQSYECEKCHFDTATGSTSIKNEVKHVNNVKEIVFSDGGNFDSGTKSCSNTYCHSDARGGAPNQAVAWTDSTPVQCDSCHNGRTGIETLEMSTDGHDRLVSSQWIRHFPCNYCHDDTIDAANEIKDFTKHANGSVDVVINSYWGITGNPPPDYDPGTKVCSNLYCHSDGTTVDPQVRPFAWTDGHSKCNTCHGHEEGSCSSINCHTDGRTAWAPGDEWKAAMPMYTNTGPGTEQSNSHLRHLLTDFPCDNCHNNTIVNGTCTECHTDSIPAGSMDEVNHINPAFHVNKVKDVSFKDGGTYDPVTKTCSNTACHTGIDPQWGASINNLVLCLTCHGTTEADVDDFAAFNGTRAQINMTEWADKGHGRPTAAGNYTSGNPPANFPGNPCWYCHDNTVLHNDSSNPFRLQQHQQFSKRFEKECVFCHMEGIDNECLTCHNDGLSLAPQLADLTSPPLSQDHTGYTNGQTSCVTACHSTDADRHKTGNGTWTVEDKADIQNQYMMMGVCLKCHDDDSNNKCNQCHTGPQYQLGFDPGTGFITATTSKATSTHFGYKHYAAYESSKGVHLEDGTVSNNAAANNELQDTSKLWALDQWQGLSVMMTSGLNIGEYKEISGNTADTLTLKSDFSNPVQAGDTYYLNDPVWKGGKFCWDCHDPHGDSNIYMIQDMVATETDGTFGIPVSRKTVVFTRKQSGLDYARTSAPYDGICNVCHTETGQHYRFDYGDGHNAGRICTSCHEHRFSDSHASGNACNTCHQNKPIPRHTGFGLPRDCTKCHNGIINTRMDIMGQFRSNSHHVQGVDVTNKHCYACHWESTDVGLIDVEYHAGYNYKTHSTTTGGDVDLVIWGPGTRPTTYTPGVTAVTFTANLIGTFDERTEVTKVTQVCLSCHSDQNNDTQPFNIVDPDNGDCKVPRQYAWDRTSVAARYSQTGTTTWGKYTGVTEAAPKNISKAFSAHGNAILNEGGFDVATGLDDVITNTRNGTENIQCFDCHSSHGSKTQGITSSYITFNGTNNGANLKETQAGKGGYQMSYKAEAVPYPIGGKSYNAGAVQCFDCHLNQTAGAKPWGYESTFGATKPITGYGDSASLNSGTSAKKERFSYRSSRTIQGGHFGASSPLKGLDGTPGTGDENVGVIHGLCTPCHDPHGVSPSLGNDQQYAVPLLKGTWLTSPYKEDIPNSQLGSRSYRPVLNYWTDRRTFGTERIAEDDTQFAGLCLRCHPKDNLTDGSDKNTAWKSLDRIHESIKGWGNNAEHSWPCSKCHQPHSSGLPRLMITNCLDYNHQGEMESGGTYGSYGGLRYPRSTNTTWVCHESPAAGGGSWTDQRWNDVTPW